MSLFRSAAETAHGAGFTYFDQLGSRALNGGIELWLRVMDPCTFETRLIKTQITTDEGLSPVYLSSLSVADLWGGAAWAEVEAKVEIAEQLRRAVAPPTPELRRAVAPLTPSGGSAHPEGSK